MAYLQDLIRTAKNTSNHSIKPINLEVPRVIKNYLIGKSIHCNIRLPEDCKYTSDYTSLISESYSFETKKMEHYLLDLSSYGRGVIDRNSSDIKELHPVEDISNRIFMLKNKDCITFGSEKNEKEKYRIRYEDGKFLSSDAEKNVLNEEIIANVIGTLSDYVNIGVPNGTKNVDGLHAAIISYQNKEGKRKWGVVGLGKKGKDYTNIKRNGLVVNIDSCADLKVEDEMNEGDHSYMFKLEHGDEILLNGIEDKDFKDAYIFKFLENLEGAK